MFFLEIYKKKHVSAINQWKEKLLLDLLLNKWLTLASEIKYQTRIIYAGGLLPDIAEDMLLGQQ